jgi:hypothetical protein
MSRRTLLSSEQRTRLFGIPTDAAEMATHYVLDPEDLALVRARRRPSNRLGFALQLCLLRHPGRPLDPSEVPPAPMLAFGANQLAIDPKLFAQYAHRAETRRDHLLELQQALRLRSFPRGRATAAGRPLADYRRGRRGRGPGDSGQRGRWARCAMANAFARTVTVKVKFADFHLITRSRSVSRRQSPAAISSAEQALNSCARCCRPTRVSACSVSPFRTSIACRSTLTMCCHCLAPAELPRPNSLMCARDRGELMGVAPRQHRSARRLVIFERSFSSTGVMT